MIQLADVTKYYGEKKAVDQLNFSVEKGEVFGLLGPNGAGKTTTIRMLIGLLQPTAGDIWIDGLHICQQVKEIHKRIGVVFELPNLYNRSSIKDNLELFAKLYAVSEDRVQSVIESLQLQDKQTTKVANLSKGWKQRVLIARALLHQPKVLFLDEPTSGLDPNTAKLIRGYVKELKEQGTTVVLTTHDMYEAEELSDRVGIMYNGQLVALDTPAQLKSRYGEKEVSIAYREDGRIVTTVLPLENKTIRDFFLGKIADHEILSMHTKEATLADVFAKLTGSELS